eukprot:GHVL01015157.1.p1 GENE.GHVL01015157.1~~GHVL01015157.1.p1  ORF type:complete len:481 (+),score=84.77 GHVL01015157.1:72-1514(+)
MSESAIRVRMGDEIARGSHGIVHEAYPINSDSANLALKKCRCSERVWRAICDSHWRVHINPCPYIVHIAAVNYERSESICSVLMERCLGPNLVDVVVRHFDQADKPGSMKRVFVRRIMKQLFEALEHLHEVIHSVHCDIKLDNLNFKSSNVLDSDICILDLDSCVVMSHPASDKPDPVLRNGAVVGTGWYLPPEVMKGCIHPSNDIWSAGVCLYTILEGGFPFNLRPFAETKDWHGAYMFIQQELKKLKFSPNVIERYGVAVDLCKKLLSFYWFDRPTATQVLQHDWFKNDIKYNNIRDYITNISKNIQYINGLTTCGIGSVTVLNKYETVLNKYETATNAYETATNEYETAQNEYLTPQNESGTSENGCVTAVSRANVSPIYCNDSVAVSKRPISDLVTKMSNASLSTDLTISHISKYQETDMSYSESESDDEDDETDIIAVTVNDGKTVTGTNRRVSCRSEKVVNCESDQQNSCVTIH